MNIEALRDLVMRLQTSANALAALGAALDARTTGVPLDPAIEPHVNEVLAALAAPPLQELDRGDLGPLLAEIRTFSHLNLQLMYPARRAKGWTHSDPDILQAMGAITHQLAPRLKNVVAPRLEGLAPRLAAESAAFLDVGTGVGRLAIDMARVFPSLRIVGVDPWAPSLALARENVKESRLDDRIELREQAGENLTDESAFDLAWVASAFMPQALVPAIVSRVHRALRPGGWILLALGRPAADPLLGAIGRLRLATFGGGAPSLESASKLLEECGYTDVQTLPGPPTAVAAIIAARRG